MTTINNRITALNGKFQNHKTLGLGKEDATIRMRDLPESKVNFSAGYIGHSKVKAAKKTRENR